MATKIDNEKLDQYIGELNSLHTEWVNYKKNPVDQGDNGGGTHEISSGYTKCICDACGKHFVLYETTEIFC